MLAKFWRWFRSRKTLTTLPILLSTTFVLLLVMTALLEPPQRHLFASARLKIFGNEISCYRDQTLNTLPDISDELPTPGIGNGIFFHETSCVSSLSGRIILSGRQACAVESAALLHPNKKVYLLFTSPGEIKTGIGDESDLAINALQSYKNIWLGHINFARYINNTPLEHLYTFRSIELSNYAGSHASDVLRYLTLWKFGGIYLDLDVVITKNLDNLGDNFAGRESDENVAAGVLGISSKYPGHIWASECLEDLSGSFSGRDWGSNGPGVITRFLRRLCSVDKAMNMNEKICKGFKVMPPLAFYPIPWCNWTMYFENKSAEKTLNLVKNSYAIHVWNKHSHSTKPDKNSAYAQIAKKFCPKVYEALQDKNF